MVILIKALQLILSLSILVLFHELGHFLAAKMFKTRVEKFYLFFDPWFSLFKIKKGETEYGIGWLPLGGYCKISGMIDESLDKEAMKLPPQPWEFRSKPAWQRLIIMLGGVTVNLLLAIAIYICIAAVWGEEYLPTSQVNKYGIVTDSLAKEMGLRDGDKIITVDNQQVDDFLRIPGRIILDRAKAIQVVRDEKPFEVIIPGGILAKMLKHKSPDLIAPRMPFEVEKLGKSSPAGDAGVKVGDRIVGINGIVTPYFDQFRTEVLKCKNQNIRLLALRGVDTLKFNLKVTPEGYIGVFNRSPEKYFSKKSYSLFAAIPAGVVKAYKGVGNYLKSLKLLFSPEVKAYESVGGFITIGNIFPSEWDWQSFWGMTAFLSIMLAILNVLPIPALDGGHTLFLLYEMATGRKPSDKFLENAQIVGMVILFALLIFANLNDVIKLFR